MIHKQKLGGHLRTLFLLAVSIYTASKTEFANNSLKSPKNEKLNIDTLIIPQGLLISEKKPDQKISCYCPFKVRPQTRLTTHKGRLQYNTYI